MKTLIMQKEDIHKGELILVNRNHPLQAGANDASLVRIESSYDRVWLEEKAAARLTALLRMLNAGEEIIPVSGYRSQDAQERIFSESLAENGKAYTEKYVAVPGCSEHQTGLAIDVAKNVEAIDFICPEFPYSGICQAFRHHAPQFGFIERYPEGKEEITAIAHEPWHFRYVGYPHAMIITREKLTLEEYMVFVKQFDVRTPLNVVRADGQFDVFYSPARAEATQAVVPRGACAQVSGNNIDGFIITLWRKSA